MTYSDTLDYLFHQLPAFERSGRADYKPGLERVRLLDEWLDFPHHRFPSIHVAGTNGKGSVSHLTASILQEAGYKTGLFTSPHLKDFRERIRINGQPIPEDKVIDFTARFQLEQSKLIAPSFFELTTLMAFDWFAQEKVDVAVIEVGLGGRLDSTNLIRPVAGVITNISKDHMDLLGNTIEQIAYEKAGIFKPDADFVIGEAVDTLRSLFSRLASPLSVNLWYAEDLFQIAAFPNEDQLTMHIGEGSIKEYKDISCALTGLYQQKNTRTVLTLVEVLKKKGFSINESAVYEGFAHVIDHTGLRGRWETLSLNPRVICDTGHNEAGIRQVVKQLEKTAYHELHIVFGMMRDKDISTVLTLLPSHATYYFTQADTTRALPAEELAGMAAEYGLKGSIFSQVKEALVQAKQNSRPDDLIFVGGSNYVVAEVL
jgi:dihydrofolate synthase/folylpolyglutamate synthase